MKSLLGFTLITENSADFKSWLLVQRSGVLSQTCRHFTLICPTVSCPVTSRVWVFWPRRKSCILMLEEIKNGPRVIIDYTMAEISLWRRFTCDSKHWLPNPPRYACVQGCWCFSKLNLLLKSITCHKTWKLTRTSAKQRAGSWNRLVSLGILLMLC